MALVWNVPNGALSAAASMRLHRCTISFSEVPLLDGILRIFFLSNVGGGTGACAVVFSTTDNFN
jgi:hypothetical protein